MATVALTLRVFLALVLGWSSVSKLTPAGRRGLGDMLAQLGIGGRVGLVGGVLLAGEAGSAVLLLLPWTAVVGAVSASGVLTALTVGVLLVLRRRMTVTCACFGSSSTRIAPVHAYRNVVLTVSALAAAVTSSAAPAVPTDLMTLVTAAGIGGVLAIVVVRLDDLAFVLAPR